MKKTIATVATAAILSSSFSSAAFASTYKVQSGDTLSSIAKKHNTTVSNLRSWNQLTSDSIYVNQDLTVSNSATNTMTVAATAKTYTVVSGDTLTKIANLHGITLAELKTWNNLQSTTIYPGQVFTVSKPAGTTTTATPTTTTKASTTISGSIYVVKSGDSLSKISTLYGISIQQLMSLNNLTSDVIYVGQTLKTSSTTTTTASTTSNNSQVSTQPVSTSSNSVVTEAQKLLGIPYVWGGSTVSGFDCSGFIYYVFNAAGKKMSRYSAEGYYDRSYDISAPQVGDLVFFQGTYKAGISHLGVYLGNNQFIHASSDGVQISSLSSTYWKQHFDSFKRFY